MKYMVELLLHPGAKDKALEAFEQRGPNRTAGVTLRGVWVAAHADVVFVLLESAKETSVAEAVSSWSVFGESKITTVIDIEQL